MRARTGVIGCAVVLLVVWVAVTRALR